MGSIDHFDHHFSAILDSGFAFRNFCFSDFDGCELDEVVGYTGMGATRFSQAFLVLSRVHKLAISSGHHIICPSD